MKLTVCDICRNGENKIVESEWRISLKNSVKKTRFALDVCEKHKHWLKGKTVDSACEEFNKLDAHLKNVPMATVVEAGALTPSAKPKKTSKKNKCKYCGNTTGSPDPDVLCEECRDTFGHAFYSEL